MIEQKPSDQRPIDDNAVLQTRTQRRHTIVALLILLVGLIIAILIYRFTGLTFGIIDIGGQNY